MIYWRGQLVIQEDLVWRGKWWTSSSKETDGTLRLCQNDGPILELEGIFDESDISDYELILGENKNNEKITVLGAKLYDRVILSHSENEIRKYSCSIVLKGMHVDRFDDIKFEKVYLTPTYITEWMLPPRTFSKILYNPMNISKNEELVYSIKAKKVRHVVKLNSLNCKIIFNLELRHFGDYKLTCEFKYIAYLVIETEAKRELNWFLEINNSLCNFFTLITGFAIFSENMGVINGNDKVSIYFKKSEPTLSKNISV
jgi:hypothetical protein